VQSLAIIALSNLRHNTLHLQLNSAYVSDLQDLRHYNQNMEIPLTGVSTLTGLVVMTIAWIFIGRRISATRLAVAKPIRMLHRFFAFMAIFFAFMFSPHLLIYTHPALFPQAMAWGYVVGHIFLYIAFTYIMRVTFTIVPQLANKEKAVMVIAAFFNVAITAINAQTMIWGTQPAYDSVRNITQLNAAVVVGAAIGIFALVSLLPAAILFLVIAVKGKGGQRVRSLLLGTGLVMMTIAGPLHDVALNWQQFLIADIFTTLSIVLIGSGVVYRLNSSLSVSPSRVASAARS
jgi:hypothetical protein